MREREREKKIATLKVLYSKSETEELFCFSILWQNCPISNQDGSNDSTFLKNVQATYHFVMFLINKCCQAQNQIYDTQ